MNYNECIENARGRVGKICKACPECNGRACGNKMPGPGSKGIGDTAIRNYNKWKEIRVQMDTLAEKRPIDTSLTLFGKTFHYPFFAGPVGAVKLHYGDSLNDVSYNDILVSACANSASQPSPATAPTATSWQQPPKPSKTQAVLVSPPSSPGISRPSGKKWPWYTTPSLRRSHGHQCRRTAVPSESEPRPPEANPWKSCTPSGKPPAYPSSSKVVMTVKGALKAKEAGAEAIVVSNHGGRSLTSAPPPRKSWKKSPTPWATP